MQSPNKKRAEYDLPTAVTFLFSGLALGWVLGFLFAPFPKTSATTPVAQRARVTEEVLVE
jgi:hypothetical protein